MRAQLHAPSIFVKWGYAALLAPATAIRPDGREERSSEPRDNGAQGGTVKSRDKPAAVPLATKMRPALVAHNGPETGLNKRFAASSSVAIGWPMVAMWPKPRSDLAQPSRLRGQGWRTEVAEIGDRSGVSPSSGRPSSSRPGTPPV